MSVVTQSKPALARPGLGSRTLIGGLALLGAYQLALALFMAVAPGTFHSAIGPFGSTNDHYLRDLATYNAALGAGALIAVRMAAWRIPVLALTVIQFALHSVNHLVDIDKADPTWVGYFDFFALAFTTGLLVWLLALARAKAHTPAPRSEGEQP
jgi:hypothetical protein